MAAAIVGTQQSAFVVITWFSYVTLWRDKFAAARDTAALKVIDAPVSVEADGTTVSTLPPAVASQAAASCAAVSEPEIDRPSRR